MLSASACSSRPRPGPPRRGPPRPGRPHRTPANLVTGTSTAYRRSHMRRNGSLSMTCRRTGRRSGRKRHRCRSRWRGRTRGLGCTSCCRGGGRQTELRLANCVLTLPAPVWLFSPSCGAQR
jgi:hypothetical protein